ncbi:GNAT family N-acetyltransferase [Archangium sp.]|uniref:GNAT family N-acetyltransferase n=1 Tax=Archangium sp. TaxID=1872627 RepID=UPI002D6B3DCB|nr:GNAT family N-acetyltransferase [Archangium sp.]HYO55642.1 GNAT family N-acetyltransferase [Archangium sp.]
MNTLEHVEIRDARVDERAAIRDLTLAAYDQYASVTTPPSWAGLRQALLTAIDAEGRIERIVAARGGELIGSVMLFPPAGDTPGGRMVWPELRLLAVAPAARGQGIGKVLVSECIRRARLSGTPVLGLYTSDMMQAAMRMYEEMGFERVPEYDFRPAAELVKAYRLVLTAP